MYTLTLLACVGCCLLIIVAVSNSWPLWLVALFVFSAIFFFVAGPED